MGGAAVNMRSIHGDAKNILEWYHTISIIDIMNSLEFNIIHDINLYSTVHLENCILLHFCYVGGTCLC